MILVEVDKKMSSKRKLGFFDRFIEKLPEMHLSGYKYCGPNTNLTDRLEHSVIGINELDWACMEHDIAYAASIDIEWRCQADKKLFLKAFQYIFAKDSKISERFAAIIVAWVIGIKLFIGKIETYIRKIYAAIKSILKK